MAAISLVPDERPPAEGDVPTCVDCGVELVYAGTGRKPTKCDDHKKRRGSGGASKTAGPPGTNEKLAAQAVEVLVQANDVGAIVLMLFGLPATAGLLAGGEERFREQAHAALLLDPGLARTILRGGAKSGRLALLMAYGTLFGSIAPTAVVEVRELRAARAASDPAPDEGEAA